MSLLFDTVVIKRSNGGGTATVKLRRQHSTQKPEHGESQTSVSEKIEKTKTERKAQSRGSAIVRV